MRPQAQSHSLFRLQSTRRHAIPSRQPTPFMFSINRFFRVVFIFLSAIAFVFLSLGASAAPPAGVLDETHAAVQAVMSVQGEVTSDLMRQPEILGTAVGVDTAGTPVLTVYVDRDSANAGEVIRNLPRQFRGVGVQIHLTDKFRAMARPPGVAASATQRDKLHPFSSVLPAAGRTTLQTASAAAAHSVRS